jgi:N-acetylated-alpha-linked acidic dipeptidase
MRVRQAARSPLFPAASRKGTVLVLALAASAGTAAWLSAQGTTPAASRVRGFSAAASAAELARERDLRAAADAKANEADFDVMTAEPHHAGSPYEIKLADYVAGKFKDFGIEATKYEYSVLLPWPGERRIEITAPDQMKLQVEEEKIRGDQWADKPGILPAYNAYSPSGDVTGEIVYVNFGIPADYETLAKLGIDVKGKIVLARYGGSWRGIKPKVAAEHGAIACLIYSDPHEDGYFQGEVYPDGPFRGPGMIQRGSVMDMPRYPGDPSTPDRPSKPGVERIPMDKIETFAPIPVQPMSYRDGVELLKRLRGPVAPEAWRGALPITYHIGPGPAKIHMKLQMEYAQRRLINVVARIPGAVAPDEWIIVGSHRDAWTFGASDSVSGHVSMMAVARAMGDMVRKGWRPRRSIVFVSWDGEEQGLLGSTEWVEDVAAELKAKAAIYVNRDAGAGGLNFSGSAVHSLAPFVHELAQSIQPAGEKKTLYDGWLDRAREQAAKGDQPIVKVPPVGALGSGSDYTAFLDHIGVSSMDIGLNGSGGDGSYHSTYDNPTWFKKYVDPQFKYSVLATELTGVGLLRLADAEILPFDYEAYGAQILEYLNDIEQQATKASADGAKRIDFAGMKAAAEGFVQAGAAARARGDALLARAPADAAAGADLARLNRALMLAERDLIEPAGLPDRPWYRHVIYAPGLYTGYGVKTIPGVREAVDSGNYGRAAEQAAIVIRALQRATATLARVNG